MKIFLHNCNPQCWNSMLYTRKIQEHIIQSSKKSVEFIPLSEFKSADVIIVWSCLILTPVNSNKVLNDIKVFHSKNTNNAKIILTGCFMSKDIGAIVRTEMPWLEYVPGTQYENITTSLDLPYSMKPKDYHLLYENELKRDDGPDYLLYSLPQHENTINPQLLLKLGWGCTHRCAYCPLCAHRSRARNLPIEVVLDNFKEACERNPNIKEVCLLSDDCGHYGIGTDKDLFYLIDEIRRSIPDVKINLEYLYPTFVIKNEEILIQLAKAGCLGVIPISIQTGSERILSLMKRKDYDISSILNTVENLRNAGASIWTEMIFDYPTETEKDLLESVYIANTYFDAVAWYPYMQYFHTQTYYEYPEHEGLGQEWQEKIIDNLCVSKHTSAKRWDKRNDLVFTKENVRFGKLS